MAHGELEIGRKYHCREETTGLGLTGNFVIERDIMKVELFSYEKFFHVDCDDYLLLRTETNDMASLHDNIPGETGHTHSRPALTTYSATIISNLVVIGRDPWPPADLVRQTRFRIPHVHDTLHHVPSFNRVANTKFGTDVNNVIFSAQIGDERIQASYNYSGSMSYNYPQKVEAVLGIEFDTPQTLREYRMRVQAIVRFFTAALGTRLHASDIGISRLTDVEQRVAIESGAGLGNHLVYEIQDAHEPRESGSDVWTGHQFVHSRDDTELSALIACLTMWIRRDTEWLRSTVLMLECMALDGVMSADRLLSACKWFEEIPGTKSEVAISPDDIEEIAKHANKKAIELGYADLAGRVTGAVKGLSRETRAQQLGRVVSEVRRVFGQDCLDDQIVSFLIKAYGFRGRVAHGHFSPEDDKEYSEFAKSVYAMECVSYLLTISDLPMLDAGKKRVLGNPMVRNYKMSFLAGENRESHSG
jgi:hypothetical protein